MALALNGGWSWLATTGSANTRPTASRRETVSACARCGVSGAHGVAVHGAGVEGWLVVAGDDRGGQYAAYGLGQSDSLGLRLGDARQDRRDGVVDRQQAHGVRTKSPDLPPDFSSTQMSVTVMARSIALAMS